MYSKLFELARRHFASAGFQYRLKHIYIPFAQKGIKYVWAWYRARHEKTFFEEQYAAGQFVRQEESPALAMADMNAPAQATALPQYETIADELNGQCVPSEAQGATGQCVAFSFCNVWTHVLFRIRKVVQRFAEYDVYRRRSTKIKAGDDFGMYPAKVARFTAEDGIALRGLVPDVRNGQELLSADLGSYNEKLIEHFRVSGLIKGEGAYYSASAHGVDKVLDVISKIPKGLPFQVSQDCTDDYFGADMPTRGTGKVVGRHSTMGVGGYAFMYRGKRCFRTVDSAYIVGRPTALPDASFRHISEDYMTQTSNFVIQVFEFAQEVLDSVNNVEPSPSLPFDLDAIVATKHKNVGGVDSMANYNLQLALEHVLKIVINGAPTKVYWNGTAAAVAAFQERYSDLFVKYGWSWNGGNGTQSLKALEGKYFGDVSVKVLREVVDTVHA